MCLLLCSLVHGLPFCRTTGSLVHPSAFCSTEQDELRIGPMRLAFACRGSLASPGNVKRSSTDVFPPPPTAIADPRPCAAPAAGQGSPALAGAVSADRDHVSTGRGFRASAAHLRLPHAPAPAAAPAVVQPVRGRGAA